MNEIFINVENYPDDPDLVIPLAITYRDGGDYDISCYPDTCDIAAEYAERFSDSLFSDEAAAFLKERFDRMFSERGYEGHIEDDTVYYLDTPVARDESLNVKNARDAVGLENLCEIDLKEAAELGQEAFVCVEEQRIVSVAVENYTHKSETEIAVETAEPYRRRGLAKAAASALCNDIIASGGAVTWHCSADNNASCLLAEAIGFRTDGREMYFCYYEN
ncbi:MAG: GNAT family N-acetyltransferase [Clostridia bacterium]|nr:GNAT family N-acetyltransferase [Clostridia bacterium]